jgi:hypothetical protein
MQLAMKVFIFFALFAASVSASAVVDSTEDLSQAGDRTITKVVKLLEDMIKKSKADGDKERELFGKFKCYCDSNELKKKTSISELTKEIGILESEIGTLQGLTGEKSAECAELRTNMMDNEASREEADAMRNKANAAFVAEEADLKQAIGQMNEAIDTLSAVGADQTLGNAAADHAKFMAGKSSASFLGLKDSVKHALTAASAFLQPKEVRTVESFIQAPFTGSYTSQSAEIVGILKNMRDTFKQNLANAVATEDRQKKGFDKLMKTKEEEYALMKSDYDDKQEELGTNDDDLAAKKTQKSEAEATKEDDEEFLAKLIAMCEAKTKDYEDRVLMRANEEAAIAEAVSILNSDAAFESFGKVSASSTGGTGAAASFVQLAAVSKHSDTRMTAIKMLQRVHSARTRKLASMLKVGNPLDQIITAFTRVKSIIEEEEKEDDEKLAWCNSEREESYAIKADTASQMTTLEEEINTLEEAIGAPETGLADMLAEAEESKATNYQNQVEETKERTKENLAYQEDIKNLQTAQNIIKKATKVLQKYYTMLEKKLAEDTSLLQKGRQSPPSTWDKGFEGQSSKGNDAVSMLEFISEETAKEEKMAHSQEESAQGEFEDSMTDLKAEEADLEKSIAELSKTLAEKKTELNIKKAEHKATKKENVRVTKYLARIKDGCDFITANIDDRKAGRATELDALSTGIALIKNMPIFKAAEAEDHQAELGECADPCNADGEDHVNCKACQAKTSVSGYCASHGSTPGC